jgi:hypothetical protein
MRHFVYGLIFGACSMYFYTFHWNDVVFVKGHFDSWREDAVEETKKYK